MTYDAVSPGPQWAIYRVGQGILVEGRRVLLCGNRWFSDRPLVWTLPGGRAEDGEGIEEALRREFREETGLEVEVGRLAYVAESRSTIEKRLFLVCAFEVRRAGGEEAPAPQGDSGVEEVRFIEQARLAEYLPRPSLGAPLLHYLEHPGDAARYWFFPEYAS